MCYTKQKRELKALFMLQLTKKVNDDVKRTWVFSLSKFKKGV